MFVRVEEHEEGNKFMVALKPGIWSVSLHCLRNYMISIKATFPIVRPRLSMYVCNRILKMQIQSK